MPVEFSAWTLITTKDLVLHCDVFEVAGIVDIQRGGEAWVDIEGARPKRQVDLLHCLLALSHQKTDLSGVNPHNSKHQVP
jgi:hypothetical protein